MTRLISIERALHVDTGRVDGGANIGMLQGLSLPCVELVGIPISLGHTCECLMVHKLLLTVLCQVEAPAYKVEATSELTAELLWTLHVGNLLKELVLSVKVGKLQVGKSGTLPDFVNPVDSLLVRSVDLVLALGGTEEHVGITHQTEVDTTMQSRGDAVVESRAHICPLCYRQSAIGVIGAVNGIGSKLFLIGDIAEGLVVAVPISLIGAYGPVKAGVKMSVGRPLALEEVIKPW